MNLARHVDDHPADGRALFEAGAGVWLTWGEVRDRARAVAGQLADAGVGPGDHVALVWPNSAAFVCGYLGALAAGAVAVPLNPTSPRAELGDHAQSVRAKAALVGPGVDPGAFGDAAVIEADALATPSVPSGASLQARERADGDLAVLLFTSGTAGLPKAAMLSHGALDANVSQMLAAPGQMVRADDVGLAVTPMFHVFGLNVVLGLALRTGTPLVCEERFDPVGALRLVREHGVTLVIGAPPMFAAWAALSEDDVDAGALAGVRLAVSGAAPLDAEVAERFTARFGIPLWQGYGLTEAGPAVSTTVGLDKPRPGSVGRPLPGVAVRLVDEHDEDALEDDPGEIWVKGPNLFAGYWDDPAATAEALTPDGWLRTGDIGVLSATSELHVVDRRKDLIIVSGFNVFPAEVERVVADMPEVADVVVVGVPDERTGEAVEAVVVARPGAELRPEAVVARCAARLARYKCPTSVRLVDALPHGLTGKALRRAVRNG